MAFLPSLKRSLFKIIFRHELFIVTIEPQVLQLQVVPASKRKQRRLSHGFVTGSYNSCI